METSTVWNTSPSVDSTVIDLDFDPMLENCCLSEDNCEISEEVFEEFEEFINGCDDRHKQTEVEDHCSEQTDSHLQQRPQ